VLCKKTNVLNYITESLYLTDEMESNDCNGDGWLNEWIDGNHIRAAAGILQGNACEELHGW
jgi:hypothetical protein